MEMQFSIECRKYYDILFLLLHYPLCPVQKSCDTLSTNQMRNLKSIVAWSFAFFPLLWQLTYIHFEITLVHVPFSLFFFWSDIVIKLVQFCSVTTYHTGHLADHHDKCCHAAVISHISLRWALYQTFRCFRAIQFGSDLTRKWMAGYIRRTHSWKRSGKKSSYLFLTLFFIKPALLMRIKNATFRHNQLVHILALPFLPLAFPLDFFFLFSPSHYFLILTLRMRSPNLSLCLPE